MAKKIFDFSGMRRFSKLLDAGLTGQSGPIDDMFKQWGKLYLVFTRRRFVRKARGGGGWAPLAASTIASRRGGKRRRTRSSRARNRTTTRGSATKPMTLRDTGVLLNSLTVGQRGNLFRRMRYGIRVGFAGGVSHEGGISIQELATIHDEGVGDMPKREILVVPDSTTLKSMRLAVVRAVQRIEAMS